MHEFSLAQSIIDKALAEADKHDGKRICTLGIRLGRASHITPDSLEFCLRAVARGTIAEEATMEIKPLEPTARCRECGHSFSVQNNELFCPDCGTERLEMLTGSEVFLDSLEVD